jgi:hypothetical protein
VRSRIRPRPTISHSQAWTAVLDVGVDGEREFCELHPLPCEEPTAAHQRCSRSSVRSYSENGEFGRGAEIDRASEDHDQAVVDGDQLAEIEAGTAAQLMDE